MPKLDDATHSVRRNRILDAAELCFARAGFHGASMQAICREAGVSSGGLYVHFRSKEALIEGIAERDRNEISRDFAALAELPDLMQGFEALGRHYLAERPAHKCALHLEIGAESTRNPAIAAILARVEREVRNAMIAVLGEAQRRGQLSASLAPERAAQRVMLVGDGLFWRRAIEPASDLDPLLAEAMALIGIALGLVEPAPDGIVAPHIREDRIGVLA